MTSLHYVHSHSNDMIDTVPNTLEQGVTKLQLATAFYHARQWYLNIFIKKNSARRSDTIQI